MGWYAGTSLFTTCFPSSQKNSENIFLAFFCELDLYGLIQVVVGVVIWRLELGFLILLNDEYVIVERGPGARHCR